MVSVKNFHHPGDLDPYPATNALSRPHPRSRRAGNVPQGALDAGSSCSSFETLGVNLIRNSARGVDLVVPDGLSDWNFSVGAFGRCG